MEASDSTTDACGCSYLEIVAVWNSELKKAIDATAALHFVPIAEDVILETTP
jgi:hypothetical protein